MANNRRRWWIGGAIGLSLVAVVAFAEIMSPDAPLADPMAGSDTAASMVPAPDATFVAASVPDQTPVDLGAGLPAHDATVGKVAGTAAVEGGAATYDIPIVLPPGRRGMQPELSLNYSSRSGNGIAGMGWSLSGISSITRCPSTLDQDGSVRGVRLDAADKLCLDGQRLLIKAGTYGVAGATYATEIDSFVRVTQLSGGLASAVANFKVETKGGEVLYYGQTANSRVTPGGGSYPVSWLLERKEDRVGNYLHYSYSDYGSGEVLLAYVTYTGFGTTDGDRRVELSYEARPTATGSNDTASTYLAGTVTRQTQRLKNIVTKVGTAFVRQWLLNYGTASSTTTGRSLLNSISDCGYNGSAWVCKPATTFTWQQGAPAYSLTAPAVGFDLGAALPSDLRPVGDFDGDGSNEVIVVRQDPSSGARQSYIVSMTPERAVRWTMAIPAAYSGLYGQTMQDFNQDGRVDLIGRDASNNLVVRIWSGSPTDTNFATAFATTWSTGISAPVSSTIAVGYVGDMDGDGRADIVMTGETGNGTTSCAKRITIYRNTPNAGNPQAAPTFPVLAQHCLASNTVSGITNYEKLDRVSDFDGDSLPDLFVRSGAIGLANNTALNRIVLGVKSGSYSLQSVAFNSVFTAADPATSTELAAGLFALWTDVNGDGLDDLVYARSSSGGKWTLRMNQGGSLGGRYEFTSGTGLQGCGSAGSQANCTSIWQPWRASKIQVTDVDGDGRNEILVPTSFAANICIHLVPDPNKCPNGDGTQPECFDRFACPEDPQTGLSVVGGANGASGQVLVDLDGNGTAETTYDTDRFQSAYANGIADLSAYYMTALRFVETSPGVISLREVPTGVVSNEGGAAADIYGDGQPDALFKLGVGGAGYAVGIPITKSDGTAISTTVSPRSLPNGLPILSRNMLLNENRGAGGALNADGLTPQTPDLIAVITDGLGGQVVWNYAPLAGEAGRVAGQTPLYTVPMVASQRYIDERHIYFTSSMQVVSEMSQSDGVGSFRTWLYGYGEAMYNTQGRGFQGFRTIIVEDEAAGTRTTTTYSQKFPLTSQPEQILVNSLHRSGTDGPISKQLFTWRCNRADRTDASACTPQSGAPTVRFVYLDTQETDTYDAATADNPNGGVPALLGYTKTIASDNASCNEVFPATSGYDANGNLTQSITLSYDGTGTGGYRSFMTRRCGRELASYAAADTVNWWLDKLNSKTTISSIAYNATNHALPTGTSNPTQTVASAYTWNTNRTAATETIQNGIASQQKITTYGYPTSNNYGLPTSISIAASGDPNGSRTATTSYSSDGYFPQTVTNALSQSVTTLTRAADGQPSQVTDPNGLRTLFDYDPFGLPTLVRSRGPADAQYLAPDKQVRISRCTGTGCVANAVLFVRTIQDGTPIVTEEKDLNGHTLRAHRTLLDGTESLVDTRYDSAGRVTQQSEPYRSGTTAYWTVYAGYDVLGRVTGKSMPTSSGQTLTTIYTYTGRTTQIDVSAPAPTVPLSMSRTTDSLGRYVETIDASGGQTKYWYDAAGNALAIRDANGSVLQAAYNAIGQRTQAVDPNQGTWNFTYDALGEVLSQTDARQIVTNYQYDVLGRTTRTSASFDYDGVTGNETVQDDFTYDPANGKGLPAGNSRTLGSLVLRTEDLTYDTLARPISNRIVSKLPDNVTGVGVTQSTSYDTYYGRPKSQDAGNGESMWLQYSDYGDVLKETDPNSGVDYRIVQAVDARGTPIQEAWGNGMSVVRQTWAQTGQVKKIDYRGPGGASVRSFDLGYDAYGNLASQLLNGGTSSESFTYDPLQRLTQASRPIANGTVNYSYDAVGNLKSKSDFSTTAASAYGYTGGACGGGPNAVKSVALAAGGSRTYCYDANGNMTSDNAGLAVRYDATQRPLRIARASVSELFDYAPDGSRFRESGTDGTLMTFGVLERRYTAPSSDKVYFANAVITRIGATRTVSYLLTDRQGGVDSVADGSGTLTETRGYDAFGKPRTGTWADASPPRLASINNTPHGFTGHEHLNSLELIHMNGRVYDYALGRFMEVDPVIQAPLNSQSLNAYSYIMNNPLSGRDPTGYASCGSVDTDTPASGSCDYTLSSGQSVNIDYKVGKNGSVSVSTSSGNFSAIAADNLATAQNGAKGQGAQSSQHQAPAAIGAPNDRPTAVRDQQSDAAALNAARSMKNTFPTEQSFSMLADGKQDTGNVASSGDRTTISENAKMSEHSHVFLRDSNGEIVRTVEALKTAFKRILPTSINVGRGKDSDLVKKLSIVNYTKGTDRVVRALEMATIPFGKGTAILWRVSTVTPGASDAFDQGNWQPEREIQLSPEQNSAVENFRRGKITFTEALRRGGITPDE